MAELKSLAHPEWPYAGSPHEWRGFVEKSKMDQLLQRLREKHDPAVYQKQNLGPDLD